MKKYIALLLALCLLTAGCGTSQEPPQEAPTQPPATQAPTTQPTEPETTVPETTAPRTVPAKVMGDGIPVVRQLLSRGDTLEVTGYDGGWARVPGGIVQTQYLRFPDEPFEPWTAYAMWNAGLYGSIDCLGEPQEKLATNTALEVLEELDDCLFVKVGEKTGFVPRSQMSKYRYVPPVDEGSSGGSGGGGGGGSRDGGDITLMAPLTLHLLAEAQKTGSANVKVDGVALVLRTCAYGDTVQVLEEAPELPGYAPILEADGSTAYIPAQWLDSAASFTPWEGYAGYNCKLYLNAALSGKETRVIYANKPLTVLWDTGIVAFIQVDGECFFADSSTLRQTQIVFPAPEESSSSGGSSSGGGDLWTPPVM